MSLLVAADGSAGVTLNDILLVYGPLGVMATLGIIFARSTINRMYSEISELRDQRNKMVETLLEVVPLMKRSTEIHERRQISDEQTRSELAKNRIELEQITRTVDAIGRDLGIKP